MAYVENFIFWGRSQYYIDNIMKSLRDYCHIYSWKLSKGESVYNFLGIYTKTLYNGVFKFYQTGLIHKVLESTNMDHFDWLPTPTKV